MGNHLNPPGPVLQATHSPSWDSSRKAFRGFAEVLARRKDFQVLSFSHFLPRIELNPEKRCPETGKMSLGGDGFSGFYEFPFETDRCISCGASVHPNGSSAKQVDPKAASNQRVPACTEATCSIRIEPHSLEPKGRRAMT